MKPIEEVFTDIYRTRGFGGTESYSGEGSGVARTLALREKLAKLFENFHVETLLDVPCGDFNWMHEVSLDGIVYAGGDIVEELVDSNRRTYGGRNILFGTVDITSDPLPKADLFLCRDCLVHFSFEDVLRALVNICANGSKYLLTTTFPARAENKDIVTGRWRTLNLEAPPFNLPPPILLLNEQCPVVDPDGMTYPDKSLGLWLIKDVKKVLQGASHDC